MLIWKFVLYSIVVNVFMTLISYNIFKFNDYFISYETTLVMVFSIVIDDTIW